MTKLTNLQVLQRGIEKELPSGLVVRVRPIDIGMLLTNNQIPDNLMNVVRRSIIGTEKGKSEAEIGEELVKDVLEKAKSDADLTLEFYNDMRSYGKAVALSAVVWPRIVPNPQGDDEMSIDWFDTDDLMALGELIGVPLKELDSFRFKTPTDVESVQPEQSGVPETEPDVQYEDVVEEPVFKGGATD